MNIADIRPGGIYVLKTILTGLFNGESTVFLFVKAHSINLAEGFVVVHLVGQPRQYLYPVTADKLIEPHTM
jgi:hypothetical protein